MEYKKLLERIEKTLLDGASFAKVRPLLHSIFDQAEAESERVKKLIKTNKDYVKLKKLNLKTDTELAALKLEYAELKRKTRKTHITETDLTGG